MDIALQISNILKNRKANLPEIEKQIHRWQIMKENFNSLDSTLDTVISDAETPDELRTVLKNVDTAEIQNSIPKVLADLDSLKERFSRDTINIGVSGQARVGKSTLLQSISGLGEEQVPTGDNLPVTAVKSQIFHSEKNIADIEFHTFTSFKESILFPYHNELALTCPQTIEEFRRYSYPENENDLVESKRIPSNITILEKLKQMQSALWSYEDLLNQPARQVDLTMLREYVAYPKDTEESTPETCQRKYLAVKDVSIYCSFPSAPVKQLGFIDLPGLGELSASTEEHHLQGLKKGVDFVILVKRPGGGDGFWSAKDGSAVNLLDKARSFQDRKDFVSILINQDSRATSEQLKALRNHILREVNQGENNKVFNVIEADAIDSENIGKQLLTPVLEHLANRLDTMDKQIIKGTFDSYEAIEERISDLIQALNKNIKLPTMDTSKREVIEEKIEDLIDDINLELRQYKDQIRIQNQVDEKYSEQIDLCYNDILNWIESGFGDSPEAWKQSAQKKIYRQNGIVGVALDQCNYVRVEISKQFTKLDNFFDNQLNEFFQKIAEILKRHTGDLLSETDPREVLAEFEDILLNAQENGESTGCLSLADSVLKLRNLQLDYKVQLHPRVRENLNYIEYETTDADNNKVSKFADIGSDNLDLLFRRISDLAEQASYQTRIALNRDVEFPKLVLFSALEQFEDELIRSSDSVKEFKRLGFSYPAELWPDLFADIQSSMARINKIKTSINDIQNNLSN